MSSPVIARPRLLIRSDELPEQRRLVRLGRRGEALKFILEWCDRLLDPAPGNKHYFDFREMKRGFWTIREGLGVWRASMMHLSLAYLLTGEERYGVASRDAMIATIQSGAADVAAVAYGTPTKGWRGSQENSHDRGQYAQVAAIAYDCCHDLYDPTQRALFIKHAIEGINVYNDPLLSAVDRQFVTHNHGRSFLLLGWYPMAIEGEIDQPEIEKQIARAIAAVELYLLSAFDQHGYPFEGFMYGQCIRDYYLFLHAVAKTGRANLTAHPAFQRYVHAMVYEVLPGGGMCNDLNDCHFRNGSTGAVIPIMSTPAGAAVPWLTKKIHDDPRWIDEDRSDAVASHMSNPAIYEALFWDQSVPVKTPAELGYPLGHSFPGVGAAVMRTGWEKNDIHLTHRCGPLKFTMHRQSDQNHLALYALGERFLVDEGYGQEMEDKTTAKKKALDRYFSRSDVHNTVLIDGRGQNGNNFEGGYAEGRLVEFIHTPAFDTSLGDASASYTVDRIIARALRRVVFVRDTPHPFFLVIDEVAVDKTDRQHKYEVLWRTERNYDLYSGATEFTIQGHGSRCAGQVIFANAKFRFNVMEHYARPQLRVELTAPRLTMVTALTPLMTGREPPRFECKVAPEGDYTIHARNGERRHEIRTSLRLNGPLGTPGATTVM